MKPCFKLFFPRIVFVLVGLGCFCSAGAENSQKEKTDALPLYELDAPALTEKAEEGDAEAQYWLGSRYYSGSDGVQQNYAQAMEWLQKAVDQRNAQAQTLLGYMYVTGSGVSADSEKGLELVRCAAAQTNRVALYDLGRFYEMGRGGLMPDRLEAMDWYIKAAAEGHASAKKSLSKLRKEADAFRMGTASNEWWEISLDELIALAETGDSDWQRHLGVRYKGYGGTPIDIEKAQYWLEQSAAQTNLSAHYSLALMYTSTTNVQPEKAFYHCSVAAEGDYRDAQNTLGRYFRDGVGTEPDRAKALHWYRKAEQAGSSSAPGNIYHLMKGRAVDHPSSDKRKAIASEEYVSPSVKFAIRDFDNQETEVRLVEYDAEQKMVHIEPALGSVDTLPLAAFSKKSHPAILEEAVHDAFEGLSVRMKREILSRKECEQAGKVFGKKGSSDYDYDGFSYALTFKNNAFVSLGGLDVECRFYYEEETQKMNMYGDKTDHERTLAQDYSIRIRGLDAKQECVAETASFILESYDTESGVYYRGGTPEMTDANPIGLWVRVIRTTVDGTSVYRDFHEKSSLFSKVSWKK